MGLVTYFEPIVSHMLKTCRLYSHLKDRQGNVVLDATTPGELVVGASSKKIGFLGASPVTSASQTFTQTYSTADKTVAAATAAALTENSTTIGGSNDGNITSLTATAAALTENAGAIGGSNDGDLPSLTATYVARTSNGGGTANGAWEDEGTLSTSGGNTYTDAAVNTVFAAVKNNIREAQTVIEQLAADNVALRAAARENAAAINKLTADAVILREGVRECATAINKVVADDLDNRQSINALIDALQALGLVA